MAKDISIAPYTDMDPQERAQCLSAVCGLLLKLAHEKAVARGEFGDQTRTTAREAPTAEPSVQGRV